MKVFDEQGALLVRGNQGPQGVPGSQGSSGGPQGDPGPQGNQGYQGNQGFQGAGFQGNQGHQGNQGYQGNIGAGFYLKYTIEGDGGAPPPLVGYLKYNVDGDHLYVSKTDADANDQELLLNEVKVGTVFALFDPVAPGNFITYKVLSISTLAAYYDWGITFLTYSGIGVVVGQTVGMSFDLTLGSQGAQGNQGASGSGSGVGVGRAGLFLLMGG